jgi:hypothetical protein
MDKGFKEVGNIFIKFIKLVHWVIIQEVQIMAWQMFEAHVGLIMLMGQR